LRYILNQKNKIHLQKHKRDYKQDLTVVYIVTIYCLQNVVSSKATP